MGACLYGFQLLQNRVAALFIAGTSRVFLICFGVHYWSVPLELSVAFVFTAFVTVFCLTYPNIPPPGIWATVLVMLL